MFYAYARPADVDVKSLQKQVMAESGGWVDAAGGHDLIPGADTLNPGKGP
jgi:hypothetical protein